MAKKKKSSFRKKVAKDVQNQKERQSSFGYLKLPSEIGVYKPKPSEKRERSFIDIIPYVITDKHHIDLDDDLVVGDLWYKRPFLVHNNIGANNESVVCLRTFGKKCPICEYREKISREGADKDDIKALNSKQRVLYAVLPKDDKEHDEKLHIWDVSPYVFQHKLNDEIEENEEYAEFPSLEDGFTLKIRFTKEVFNGNVWADVGRIDFEERDEAYDESLLEDVPNLDNCLKELSYQKLEAMFMEEEDLDVDDNIDEDDLEDEVEEKPRKVSRKKKTVKAPEPDDEVEEEEVEEVEEEEEKPKPSRRRKTVKEPEPEEEEDDDKDTMEDTVPRRKSSKKSKSKKSPECPYGHKFGIDCDADHAEDDCDVCDIWSECNEAKEEMEE